MFSDEACYLMTLLRRLTNVLCDVIAYIDISSKFCLTETFLLKS